MNRRNFLQTFGTGIMVTSVGAFPLRALAAEPEFIKLTILHTNDVHSRIEPFPMDGGRYQGLGGAARRAALIEQVRATEENVLLFDSGDIFQGTPYFNFYGGELEFKLMSEMRYDAATIGNHDFDAGIDGLYEQLPHANFPFISSNYDFSDTIMNGKTLPYKIFNIDKLKIGVLGVGIELEGLVPAALYQETRYLDPIEQANHTAAQLKGDEKCDYVICLSHLGYKYGNEPERPSDVILAARSKNIDLILGGHTDTFLDQPDVIANQDGKPVLINQVGWAGILLGRLDIIFERNRKNRCETCANIFVTMNAEGDNN